MQNQSAIVQMLLGKKGHVETVVHSQEHNEKSDELCEKYHNFRTLYADNPEILKHFEEVCEAHYADQATAEMDFYVAGFSFGVLMGIDIMNVNLKND